MPTKKLLVSPYLQYILIALGALLLVKLVQQPGGVLLTFLLAAVLACVLNPLVRRLEGWGVPRRITLFLDLVSAVPPLSEGSSPGERPVNLRGAMEGKG